MRQAANDALDAGTAEALHHFLSDAYEKALREDDAVATATLISTAGPYTTAYAQAALEGPAWVRRNFLTSIQHTTAQLDHDSATHIAAIQGAIAAAAKIAHRAQEDAARAQQAAAVARDAASEAETWADAAKAAAGRAATAAQQANTYADSAERSARNAQASATRARQAAATARIAARSSNYSANRAVDAARRATSSANAAQASAASARSSALQAGHNAQTAAAAASQAHQIATDKRSAEVAADAKRAAEEARAAKEAGTNPADKPEHDTVKGGLPWWKEGARWMANATEWASIGLGFAAAFVSPFFPVAGLVLGASSLAFAGISSIFTGIGYGFTGGKFVSSLAGTALGALTFGQTRLISAFGGTSVATKVTNFGHDLVSPITGSLGKLKISF
ncbi:ALF repeat-containing protein [Streptomyces buecherae]|uniref:ALF repeat-containing protein n=1 Tax=Streptomyces buecherae TaxID=2763006 RepID=UPI001E5DC5D9|nr:ALF repeat-containing protein [Streptomyces buecherae]